MLPLGAPLPEHGGDLGGPDEDGARAAVGLHPADGAEDAEEVGLARDVRGQEDPVEDGRHDRVALAR